MNRLEKFRDLKIEWNFKKRVVKREIESMNETLSYYLETDSNNRQRKWVEKFVIEKENELIKLEIPKRKIMN